MHGLKRLDARLPPRGSVPIAPLQSPSFILPVLFPSHVQLRRGAPNDESLRLALNDPLGVAILSPSLTDSRFVFQIKLRR